MNDAQFGLRIRQALNRDLPEISPAASRRLEAARHLALARQKQPVSALAIAGAGTHAAAQGNLHHHTPLRQFFAVLALLLGMWIAFYWHSTQYITELEEVDSAILSDDLPPAAFLDNEFFEWLKDDSSEE